MASTSVAIYTQDGNRYYFAQSTWPLIARGGILVHIEVRRCRVYEGGKRSNLLATDGKYVVSSYSPGRQGRGLKSRMGYLVHTFEELEKALRLKCRQFGYSHDLANDLIRQVAVFEAHQQENVQ